MTSSRLVKMLLVMAVLAGLASLAVSPPPGVLAQSPPTPTNITTPATPRPPKGGGGGEGGKEAGTPMPPGMTVSGYVYDYSNRMRQPGIPVILDGGGWRAETVSDSNGLYQFFNLGAGSAVLNLRLPPGTHAVAPDWPVSLSGVNVHVDLGYYWGDNSPLPVLLSGSLQDSNLLVLVENRTGDPATGSLIDVRLPVDMKALPGAQLSQGTLDYSEHRLRVMVGDIPAGAKATLTIPVQRAGANLLNRRSPGQAAPLPQAAANIQIAFTYDQQITPQLVAVAPNQAASSAASAAPAAQVAATATPLPPSAQPPLGTAAPTPQAATPAPLPITGNSPEDNGIIAVALPALLVLLMVVAGWWSLRARR
jgi:hypothetical protein